MLIYMNSVLEWTVILSDHSILKRSPGSCCPSFVLAIQTLESVQPILNEGVKKSPSCCYLNFSEERLTGRAGNALPIEITTKAPGALNSISAGLGKKTPYTPTNQVINT